MKIICISDTHNKHSEIDIPAGDVIIHAGDFTEAGSQSETKAFLKWFSALPHPHKILVSGNHDFYLEKHKNQLSEIIPENIHYLVNNGITIENVNFWGSPYTPGDGDWAFNLHEGIKLKENWKNIPQNTHFLITHSPPYGILDELDDKMHIGSTTLLKRINSLQIPHHIFGHVHNDYGIVRMESTVFLNAASIDEKHRHINAPLVVHYRTS